MTDSQPTGFLGSSSSQLPRVFHHDDDYQFALAVQESFKTLPPGFNVEEFERSQPNVGGEINPSEQLIQAMSPNPTPRASDLKLDTLATAVNLLENLPLE